MNNNKLALRYALIAIALLAVAMVAFYYVQSRTRTSENDLDMSQAVSGDREQKSEFVGIYSPSDGPLEAGGQRISFFTVNREEDGGYLGSAKVDTVGADASEFFPCVDVRLEGGEFFLNCKHPNGGAISLNGQWTKDSHGAIQVDGKVLWIQGGNPVLDVQRIFQQIPGE